MSVVVAVEGSPLAALLVAARGVGEPVTVLAVGPAALAEAAAALGPELVRWLDSGDRPVEALAGPVADAVAQDARDAPRVLVADGTPGARVLLAAAARRVGAALLGGVLDVRAEGAGVVVRRRALDGAAVQTIAPAGPVACVLDTAAPAEPAEADPPTSAPARVEPLGAPAEAADLRVESRTPVAQAGGLHDATRVVSVGRGLRARADLELVGTLTAALDAELACSMPVADDLGWVPKERYVGRSGQHIAPRLYLALGISGMPQHLEGVRDAKVVVAVNNDPAAPVFRTADYGIVGDLYEVVPALVRALTS